MKLRIGKIGSSWTITGGGYNTNDLEQFNALHRYLKKLNGDAYGG